MIYKQFRKQWMGGNVTRILSRSLVVTFGLPLLAIKAHGAPIPVNDFKQYVQVRDAMIGELIYSDDSINVYMHRMADIKKGVCPAANIKIQNDPGNYTAQMNEYRSAMQQWENQHQAEKVELYRKLEEMMKSFRKDMEATAVGVKSFEEMQQRQKIVGERYAEKQKTFEAEYNKGSPVPPIAPTERTVAHIELTSLLKNARAKTLLIETAPAYDVSMPQQERIMLPFKPTAKALDIYATKVLPIITQHCANVGDVQISLGFYDLLQLKGGSAKDNIHPLTVATTSLVRNPNGKWELALTHYFQYMWGLMLEENTRYADDERTWADPIPQALAGIEYLPDSYWNKYPALTASRYVFAGHTVSRMSNTRPIFSALIRRFDALCPNQLQGNSRPVTFATTERRQSTLATGAQQVTIIHGQTPPVLVNNRYASSFYENEGKISDQEPVGAIQDDATAFIKEQGCTRKSVQQLIENYYRLIEDKPSLQKEAMQTRTK